MFMEMAGVKLTHVPYKGATAATADLAAGRVQVMFVAHSLALPYLPNERIKLIAFAGGERSKAMPNIPTVAESGVPGFDYASWVALFVLKGTPPEWSRSSGTRPRRRWPRRPGRPAREERLEIWTRRPMCSRR